MKKFYAYLLVLALPATLLLYSYVSGSPGGKTGSPGDNGATCTDCHTGTAQTQSNWITSTIPAEGYTPGQTYQITATGIHSGVVKFGFELTAEDIFGSKSGIFAVIDPNRTRLANAGKSVTHQSAGTTPTGNSNIWTVNWTAPTSGTVRFYAAFNAANGNGTTSGDVIYTSSLVVNELVLNPQITGIDPDHAPLEFEGEFSISGQDTEWNSGVSSVRFVNHDDETEFFEASSISVVSNTLLNIQLAIPGNMTLGAYDIHVDDLVLENGFIVDELDNIYIASFQSEILLYPNPASDVLSISAPEGTQVVLFDMQGKQLKSMISGQDAVRVNVSDLTSGIYFARLTQNGQVATVKWLKK